jgi:hypothetical protein
MPTKVISFARYARALRVDWRASSRVLTR